MNTIINERKNLDSLVVTAAQMQAIENRIFAGGMPIAALMEKAALLTAQRIQELFTPCEVGVLVGPGHNGGDALVIARELFFKGFSVSIFCPFSKLKDLTEQHFNYAKNLGINFVDSLQSLEDCQLIIDGFFGFGLTRNLEGEIAQIINIINSWQKTVISIDIPSGINTDTGEVLGVAIIATYSLCLGLWKLAYFQDQALAFLGKSERLDFGVPPSAVWSILAQERGVRIFTKTIAQQFFPSSRPLVTHKYQQGHALLICGSSRYGGSAILTALGARSSGVGMLSVAVPKSLKPLLMGHLPEALIIECPETDTGAIASLPDLDFNKYQAIACGPGLTMAAETLVASILEINCPLLLDADALNIIARNKLGEIVKKRHSPTVLTPHEGEFKRLFPSISPSDRLQAVMEASKNSAAIVLFKGSRTAIAFNEQIYLIPESTPALARGGSGDVLTGLIGGLMAQKRAIEETFLGGVVLGAWWHSQAGILAAQERGVCGVDAFTLTQYLHQVPSLLF